MRAEVLVQRVDDVGDLQLAGLLDGAAELVPEGAHQGAPVHAAVAHVVELGFQA